MKYALGNMLNGAGGFNPDGLSLDLQFAADKTLTARRGPTPVLTRASNATYYGPLVNFDGETYPTTGIVNGRAQWKIVNGSDYKSFEYAGSVWRYTEFLSGEGTTFDSAATSVFRPEQADWSGSGLASSPTTSSTFGIVRSAVDEPRFDHNPVSPFACRGLLIEEGRTNLVLQSENFASGWFKTGGSISSVANVEPDGSANSELFTEDTLSSTHRTFQSFTGTSGTVYTLSVFLKFAGRQYVFLENRSITTNPYAVFDIQNGSIFSTVGSLTSTIQAYPNGWYRCSVTGTANAAGGNYLIGGYSGDSQSYTGSGGPAFYAWGAQVEAGSFPTSYIPTTTSTLARSADVCSITGANFTSFYNQPEGTIYTESRPASVNGTTTIFGVSNGTSNERWLNRFAQNEQVVVTASGVESGLDALNPIAGTLYKVAVAAKLNDIAMSINGLAVVTDTSQPMPTVDRATIGSVSSTVASIRYYKKRLANAKLASLTV